MAATDKANRPNFIVFGILLVLVAVLMAVFIPRHTEPGLLKACRKESTGEALYSGSCFELEWERRGPHTVSSNNRELAEDLIDVTNRMLGCKAFVYSDVPGENDVIMLFDTIPVPGELPGHGGGVTTHYLSKADKVVSATVKIANLVLEQDIYSAGIHELGHVAGLAHDDFKSSIMRDPPAEASTFTDDDKDTVCSRAR